MSWVAVGVVGASAVAGAVAGAAGNNSSNSAGINLTPQSAIGAQGQAMWSSAGTDLTNMVNAGPGQQSVTDSLNANQSLAAALQAYAAQGGPNSAQIGQANTFANQMFQPQSVALQQSFLQQNQQAANQAALMGRSPSDPVLAAKLATSQTQQQQMLNAQQGAFAANYAQQIPGQQINALNQRANVLGGLATQAMANRQALASMGSQMMTNDQNWRIQTGTRWGQQQSGGGVAGGIEGGLAGAGSGMKAYSGMSSMGGFGGGNQAPNPFASASPVTNNTSNFGTGAMSGSWGGMGGPVA